MNREKSIFYFEKQNLEHIGNSVHTTEHLAFGKALLVRLYLKVKVYVKSQIGSMNLLSITSNKSWFLIS